MEAGPPHTAAPDLRVPGAFFTKVVEVGATSLKFEIWDTAGQEKYHSICHLYFRGANAAVLVYDITSKVRLALPACLHTLRKASAWVLPALVCSGRV